MTLWSIARAPLMHGGDMTKTDDFTLSLLTNDEVLAVNQHSSDNRPLFDHDGLVAWTAMAADGDTYLAVFNTRDRIALVESNAREPAAVITSAPDSAVGIDTDLRGGKKLFLLAAPVQRGDDTFQPVMWQSPRFVFRNGKERPLTEFPWTHAEAQWDSTAFKDGRAEKICTPRPPPSSNSPSPPEPRASRRRRASPSETASRPARFAFCPWWARPPTRIHARASPSRSRSRASA